MLSTHLGILVLNPAAELASSHPMAMLLLIALALPKALHMAVPRTLPPHSLLSVFAKGHHLSTVSS